MIKLPLSENTRKKYLPPFFMCFTEDERRALELVAAGRPLAAYIRATLQRRHAGATRETHTRNQS